LKGSGSTPALFIGKSSQFLNVTFPNDEKCQLRKTLLHLDMLYFTKKK
jgi:hypothetical protein